MKSAGLYAFFLLIVFIVGWQLPFMGFQEAALVVLVGVLALLVAIPQRWAILIALIYIGFEGFFKVISNYHPLVHVGSDMIVILLSLKVIARALFSGNPLPKRKPPLLFLFALHFLWIFITLFNPYSLGFLPSIAGSKIYVTMPLLFFFAYYECRSVEDFQFFIKGFLFMGSMHTLFGLYQSFIGPESVLSLHPRYAVQLEKYKGYAFRPFGLTHLPGAPAVYLAPLIPLSFYMVVVKKRSWILPLLFFSVGAISLVFLCQVRSALLKVILGSFLFIVSYVFVYLRSQQKKNFPMYPVVISCLIFLVFIPKVLTFSTEQNQDNELAIERSLSLFDYDKIKRARRNTMVRFQQYLTEVPFGAGFSRVGAAAGAFQQFHQQDPFFEPQHFFADNFWIACLIEVGVPGMLLLTIMLLLIILKGIKSFIFCRNDQVKMAIAAVLAAIIPIVVGLYGAEGILYNPDSSYFWFLSGILLKLPELSQNQSGTICSEIPEQNFGDDS